jgi:uncharacterized protein (TIGR02172 family)
LRLRDALLLDRGFTSDVYEWGDEQILKLFHGGTDPLKAEREFVATRAVHALGLPAPDAFEMVELDGRRGIVMERIRGVSMLQYVQSRPWRLKWAVRELAALHVRVNSCTAPDSLLKQRERIAAKLSGAQHLSPEERQQLLDRLQALPDGDALCHGDFHPANIMCTRQGPVIIDWETASRGRPAGDAACTLLLMQRAHLPSWSPRFMHALLALTRSAIHRGYLRGYLR